MRILYLLCVTATLVSVVLNGYMQDTTVMVINAFAALLFVYAREMEFSARERNLEAIERVLHVIPVFNEIGKTELQRNT